MRWERLGTVSTLAMAHSLAGRENLLVLRDTTAVIGWNPHDSAFAWVHELPDDEMFAMKRIYAAGDAVVTIVVTASGLAKRLLWLEPDTGRVLRQVECPLETSQGGFAMVDGIIFVHGKTPAQQWKYLRIDGASGETLSEGDAPAGREIISLKGKIYLHAWARGWFHTSAAGGPWQHLDIGKVASAVPDEHRMFFFLAPSHAASPWPLVCWDDARQQECGRILMDVPQALILETAGEPGVVAAYTRNLGLWVVDLAAGKVLWRLPASGGRGMKVVAIPGCGLAVSAGGDGRPPRIEVREPRTGHVNAELPLDTGHIAFMHWIDDLLIVSEHGSLSSFRLTPGSRS